MRPWFNSLCCRNGFALLKRLGAAVNNAAVADPNNAFGVFRYFLAVRNHQECFALLAMQLIERERITLLPGAPT